MQSDPIGYGDGMNMYNYVGSDPVNKVDPTGLAVFYNCVEVYLPPKKLPGPAPKVDDIVVYGGSYERRCSFSSSAPPTPPLPPPPPPPPGAPGGQVSDCVFRTESGVCVYKRDKKGKLQMTDEYRKGVCAGVRRIQDRAGVMNDTLGFPGTEAGAGAAGAAAAKRASGGVAMAAYTWFLGLVAQTTSGQGWKPYGMTIVPKADTSMCER